MSSVVGIDLSSKAIDLVKLDEESNQAEWQRVELTGLTAWDRTLTIHDAFLDMGRAPQWVDDDHSAWWDDVYLVAIEAPMGFGSNKLDRVVGAIASSLPASLRRPECCWIVRPDEWKGGLGLKGKPTGVDVHTLSGGELAVGVDMSDQNARDAYCIAMWARDENAKGVQAA